MFLIDKTHYLKWLESLEKFISTATIHSTAWFIAQNYIILKVL